MSKCNKCNAEINRLTTACPKCGAKQNKNSGCAVVVLVCFGLLFTSGVIKSCSNNNTATKNTAPTTYSETVKITPKKVDPAIIFEKSKSNIKEIELRTKENDLHLKKYYGSPDQIKQATVDLATLASIKTMYEKSEAKEEKNISARANSLINLVAQQQRMIYASATEEIFIKEGMDVKVIASGTKKDQLQLKYILMSQPLVYRFHNEVKISEQAKAFGFKKILYSNGHDKTWAVDL